MKKMMITVAISLLATLTFAQNDALKVPKFKGIEITGTVEQFGSKLSSQGFTFMDKDGNTVLYKGRFAGVNDCFIYLIPVENSKDIAYVNVMLGLKIGEFGEIYSYETWERLLGDYEGLKDLLTEKYGNATEQHDGFASGALTFDSYSKLSSVKEGESEYYAQWGNSDVDKMVVKLSITGGKNMGKKIAVILLQYVNTEKSNSNRKEILDDL